MEKYLFEDKMTFELTKLLLRLLWVQQVLAAEQVKAFRDVSVSSPTHISVASGCAVYVTVRFLLDLVMQI